LLTLLIPVSSTLAPHHLPSFPTRRSSDLTSLIRPVSLLISAIWSAFNTYLFSSGINFSTPEKRYNATNGTQCRKLHRCYPINSRSEEHTSELQSRFDLVCRLLLEKKKK